MKTNNHCFDYASRIREAFRNPETETPLGRAVARMREPFQVGDGKKWLYEGFISAFSALFEALRAIDDSIPPGLPPHLLDPARIAKMFGLPLEDFNYTGGAGPVAPTPHSPTSLACAAGQTCPSAGQSDVKKHQGCIGLPTEVSTAEAGTILGVSKDTVLKLKEAGLLEYRNTAPPASSRPVYVFTLRSVIELRTSNERDDPTTHLSTEITRRKARGKGPYKHLNLDD